MLPLFIARNPKRWRRLLQRCEAAGSPNHMTNLYFCRTVAILAIFVGSTAAQSLPAGTKGIKVQATDIVWDATRSHFWVGTNAGDPTYPDSILSVDPETATVTDQINCGSQPSHLAISADGQFLYASFDQLGSVWRYPLPSHTPDLQVAVAAATSGLTASALAVLPDTPGSFIVAVRGSTTATLAVAVYDGSTKRPNTASALANGLFFQSPSSVAAFGGQIVVFLNVNSQGVSIASSTPGFPFGGARPFDSHRYVTDDWGDIFDMNAGKVIGRGAGITRCFSVVDQSGDALVAVDTSRLTSALASYSLSTFRPIATMPLTQLVDELLLADNSGQMKTWGTDGLAIETGVHLLFLHLSSLQPVPAAAPSITTDPSGAIRIGLQTGGLAYDATRNHLLASVAGVSGGSLGNTIAQIDPASGAIVGSIFAGSEPGPIFITDDGTRVFAGLSSVPIVVPVNLQSNAAEQPFSVLDTPSSSNYWFAEDLVTLANTSNSVAVVRVTNQEGPRSIVVYDNGVPRPGILTGAYLADRIYRGDTPQALFSLDLQDTSFAFNRLLVSSTGVAMDRPLAPIVSTFNGTIAYASGNFYSSDGTLSTGGGPTQIGAFAGSGVPIPFPDQNAVVYAGAASGQISVSLFDTNTYRPLSAIQFRVNDRVLSGVRTGPTSFALRTASEVILISFGNMQAWPNLSPTVQAVAPGVTKMPLLAASIAPAPDGRNLLVGTSSVAGSYGNCVLTVNPITASILASGYVGSEPVELSVVPGGNEVYASVSGEVGIARFNLATSKRDLGFIADPTNQGNQYYVFDIAAAPDGSVAASFYDGSIAMFDNGKIRPKVDLNNDSLAVWTAGETGFQLVFNSAETMAYGYNVGGLKRLSVAPAGVRPLSVVSGLTGGWGNEIRWAGGRLYSAVGDVIDPERSHRVGQFQAANLGACSDCTVNSTHVWPDSAAAESTSSQDLKYSRSICTLSRRSVRSPCRRIKEMQPRSSRLVRICCS